MEAKSVLLRGYLRELFPWRLRSRASSGGWPLGDVLRNTDWLSWMAVYLSYNWGYQRYLYHLWCC